jgi:hypothetical protein
MIPLEAHFLEFADVVVLERFTPRDLLDTEARQEYILDSS